MQYTHHWGQALGFQQITGASAATALTVPAGACMAIFQVDTQNARWRDDGTNPSSTVGMLVRTTDQPYIYAGNLSKVKFIEATSGAVINVSYYGFA